MPPSPCVPHSLLKQSCALLLQCKYSTLLLQHSTYPCYMQYAKKGDNEDGLSVADTTNGIDPDWVTADRVIAQQDKKGGFSTPGYLC